MDDRVCLLATRKAHSNEPDRNVFPDRATSVAVFFADFHAPDCSSARRTCRRTEGHGKTTCVGSSPNCLVLFGSNAQVSRFSRNAAMSTIKPARCQSKTPWTSVSRSERRGSAQEGCANAQSIRRFPSRRFINGHHRGGRGCRQSRSRAAAPAAARIDHKPRVPFCSEGSPRRMPRGPPGDGRLMPGGLRRGAVTYRPAMAERRSR